MDITASPAAAYSRRSRAMFSNWALRSGCWPIVFFFRAVRQPILSLRSSRRIVRRLAGVPSATSRRDNARSDRCVHSTPARMGSPAVNSCNKWRRLSSQVGCATVHGGAPPFFGGCVPPLHPWPPLVRGGLDRWFLGRTPKGGRCTQSRHAPAWRPQWPHIDVDLSPTATQRIVASSLQARLYIRPYRPPGCRAYTVARILQLKQAGKLFFTVSLVGCDRSVGRRTTALPPFFVRTLPDPQTPPVLCPAQLPGALHTLAISDLIGINSFIVCQAMCVCIRLPPTEAWCACTGPSPRAMFRLIAPSRSRDRARLWTLAAPKLSRCVAQHQHETGCSAACARAASRACIQEA